MLARIKKYVYEFMFPPPVTWEEIIALVVRIERVDEQINLVRFEQSLTNDVYMYSVMEQEIQTLIRERTKLSRRKQASTARARRQGPGISTANYEKLM